MKNYFVIIFSLLFPLSICAQTSHVGIWDRFEGEIENVRQYDNPYTDVTLNLEYTSPDNQTIHFWGFYDGDNLWKFRFMPDQPGRWTYKAQFSDKSKSVSGSFECVPSDIPGMLSVDESNPMWFGFKGGKHGLIRSFHVGDRFFAENWDDENRMAFLDWFEGQGYNMLSIASHYLNRDSEGRGKGWVTPDLWPLNADEYQKMERILDELAKRKIMVYPFAGFFGKNSDFPTEPDQQDQYIRYTLARIAPYWNLLFNVAGPEPNLKKHIFLTSDEVARLGKKIKALDPFGHLISVHNRTGDDPYKDSDWTDYGILQGPKTTNRKKLNNGLLESHHSAKPLYAQETLWSGNKYHPEYSDEDLRKNTYVIHMSATALNFADMDGNSSSGFSGNMDLSKRNQHRHDIVRTVWDFFETIPFYSMSPAQNLVDNGFCLARKGERYLVYLEQPGQVSIKIVDGPYQVEWINAQKTSDRRKAGKTLDGQDLTSPDAGDDWLLYLTKP